MLHITVTLERLECLQRYDHISTRTLCFNGHIQIYGDMEYKVETIEEKQNPTLQRILLTRAIFVFLIIIDNEGHLSHNFDKRPEMQ